MKTIIKPIPDREGEGILDPRVLRDARIAIGVSYPADNLKIREEELEQIRREVGAKNRDIIKGKVEVCTEQVPVGKAHMAPVRIYRPDRPEGGKAGADKALLYLHGGGFVAGRLEMCDNLCRGAAKAAGAVVCSVDYSLAPEARYPVQAEECFAVLEWMYGHAEELGIDREHITVCGDSAGGNLAAVCALKDRDRKTGYLRGQILLYPALNIGKFETEAYRWQEDCYLCKETGADLEIQKRVIADVGIFDDLMQHTYVEDPGQLRDPYVCPLLAEDLSGLPGTMLTVGEFDYLRPEIMHYAERLDEAGGDVTYIQYQGINHGFAERLGTYPQAEDLLYEIVRALK